MSNTQNLQIDQGIDYSREMTVYDMNKNVFQLNGYTGKAHIKKSFTSPTFVAFTVTVTDAPNGRMKISLTHLQTEALTAGNYVYDIYIKNFNGSSYKIVDGIISVIQSVTKYSA